MLLLSAAMAAAAPGEAVADGPPMPFALPLTPDAELPALRGVVEVPGNSGFAVSQTCSKARGGGCRASLTVVRKHQHPWAQTHKLCATHVWGFMFSLFSQGAVRAQSCARLKHAPMGCFMHAA